MVNTLTAFAAEKKLFIVLPFSYHYLFRKGKVTVGTCYLSQVVVLVVYRIGQFCPYVN